MATFPRPLEPSKILADRIRNSFQIALELHDKVATGDTLRGIKVVTKRSPQAITYNVYAGPGFYFTQWGKRANTKLPVYRENGKFKLVEPLARWKKALHIEIPDFLLARSIARRAREPINVIASAEADMTTYLDDAVRDSLGLQDSLNFGLSRI